MSWHDQWRALDARMAGFLEVGRLAIDSQKVTSDDAYGVNSRVIEHGKALYEELKAFGTAHSGSLPPKAASELAEFIGLQKTNLSGALSGYGGAQLAIVVIANLRAVLTYHLSDFTVVARRRSERAFIHLQQSLVADAFFRERWAKAFESGEPACERLGATHLLLHGIWAFKAHGPGARTDLVLGEQLLDVSQVDRAAEALVLTEWKVVRTPTEAASIAASAIEQARLYGTGLLGGIELATYRYIVLVSQSRLAMPPDLFMEGVTYRHVGIAIYPETPSKST